jgi:hypothetical protein
MGKFAAIFIILLVLIGGCKRIRKETQKISVYHQTESKGFPFTISNGKLGTISIGDRIDSTLKNLSTWFYTEKDSMESCEGCTTYTPIYIIRSKGSFQYLFSIEPGWEENNKTDIVRIRTGNPIFITDEQIKIGMTVKDLKNAYEILEVSAVGDLGIHVIVKDFKGSFGIELPNINDWLNINKSTISDSLRINEIIIAGK